MVLQNASRPANAWHNRVRWEGAPAEIRSRNEGRIIGGIVAVGREACGDELYEFGDRLGTVAPEHGLRFVPGEDDKLPAVLIDLSAWQVGCWAKARGLETAAAASIIVDRLVDRTPSFGEAVPAHATALYRAKIRPTTTHFEVGLHISPQLPASPKQFFDEYAIARGDHTDSVPDRNHMTVVLGHVMATDFVDGAELLGRWNDFRGAVERQGFPQDFEMSRLDAIGPFHAANA